MLPEEKKTVYFKNNLFSLLFDNNRSNDLNNVLMLAENARKTSETCAENVNETLKTQRGNGEKFVTAIDLKLNILKRNIVSELLTSL